MRSPKALLLPGVLSIALVSACGSRLSQAELTALNPGSTTAAVSAPTAPGIAPNIAPGMAPATAPGAALAPSPPIAGATPTAGPGPAAPGPGPRQPPVGTTAGKPIAPIAERTRTDNQPVTVCSVSELAGPAGAALAQGVTGITSWVGEVNARGGVLGHRIRLLVKDSGSDPAVALALTRSCVENDGAVALVGSMAPLTGRSIQSYLESKGVPAIGGDCGATVWNDSPAFFNQCPSVETMVWGVMAEAARVDAAHQKFAFLYCQEAGVCAEARALVVDRRFAQLNGLELAYVKQFSLVQLDFTSECAAMKSAGVSTAFAVGDPSSLQRLGQSCSRQGFNPTWSQSYASVAANTPTKAGLGNIRLIVPVVPFCCLTGKDAENPSYQRFVSAFARFGGGQTPGPAAPIGYTAGLLFERFLAEVAKTSPAVTSAGLLAAAGSLKKETLGGAVPPINLTPGRKTPDSGCWFVMVAREGGQWQTPNGLRLTCRKLT
jgi:branched-chain amino acid transport system substrate-binding protein